MALQGVDVKEAKVGVAAGIDMHLLWEVHCDSARISWKGLDGGVGPSIGRVVGSEKDDQAVDTLTCP